jgi:thioredoxin-related protein
MKAETSRYIMVKIDAEKNEAAARKYNVTNFPTVVFLNSRGKMVQQKVGFSVPDGVKGEANFVKYAAKDVNAAMKWVRNNKL